MKNFKLKLFMTTILGVTACLSVLNFVVSECFHSSVAALAAIINFSHFVYYSVKLYLSVYKKKNFTNSSRFGILIDLITSIFVCSTCFSIIIESFQYIMEHHIFHDINYEKDDLHHKHCKFGSFNKDELMLIVGLLTFCGDFLIFLINLGLNTKHRDIDSSLIPEGGLKRDNKTKVFKPFNDIKVKKENCILLIPSDLVKCKKKFLDITALFIASIFMILCSFLNKMDFEIHGHSHHHDSSDLNQTTIVIDSAHMKHHDNYNHNVTTNHVKTLSDFLIINIDPLSSLIVIGIYFYLFGSILKVSCLILSQAVPEYIDIARIKDGLMEKIPEIIDIHDLHLYEFNPFHLCISMHFIFVDNKVVSQQKQIHEISEKIKEFVSDDYYIYRVILQPEVVQSDYNVDEHHNCLLEENDNVQVHKCHSHAHAHSH